MWIHCPKDNKTIGEVKSYAPLNLSVHCPWCGHDFGVSVEPELSTDEPSAPTAEESVAGA